MNRKQAIDRIIHDEIRNLRYMLMKGDIIFAETILCTGFKGYNYLDNDQLELEYYYRFGKRIKIT